MKLALLLALTLVASGCGGTLILENRNNRVPAPPPPTSEYPSHEIGRQEAVALVAAEAGRQHVGHTVVRKIERQKRHWKIDMCGMTRDGRHARIKSTVHRWSGDLLSYSCKVEGHKHGRGHDRGHGRGHDDDDDHRRGRGHDDD
jgi:hypothetical protein